MNTINVIIKITNIALFPVRLALLAIITLVDTIGSQICSAAGSLGLLWLMATVLCRLTGIVQGEEFIRMLLCGILIGVGPSLVIFIIHGILELLQEFLRLSERK